ncbi:AAA family ATPase [Xanthobacter sp. DSM 24535]|uniref:AAA family ATPase n=1 Tax=Roseixanthobacter psychrophilus TaxID=3119917 RepID=UPI003729A7D1
MRLRRLDLTRYGKFTDHAIDFGARTEGVPDLHIVYGLNEAGKSTALSAYLDLLFGIEERSRYNFLHPYSAMEIGATLEFGDGLHELKRVKQRSSSLRDGNGHAVNEALLSVPLAGLSREAYRLMFSLDDQTLEEGGNAILESKGDLGELLFSASAGLADLSRTLEGIAAEADQIFRKRASTTEIAGLKRRLAELKAQREQIDVQASAHAALVAALGQAEQAYDAANKERAAARTRQDELGRVLRAAPLADAWRQADAARAALAHLPRPPAQWAGELPALMVDDTRLQTQWSSLDAREQQLRGEIAGLVPDPRLLALGERLEQLAAASVPYLGALDHLPKRRATLAVLQGRIGTLLRALGREDEAEGERLLVPAPVVGTLRDLIEQRSGVAADADACRAELNAAILALEQARADRRRLDGGDADAGRVAAVREIVMRVRQSDLSAGLRLAARDLPQAERLFADACAALAPWAGDGPALRALCVPDGRQIEQWRGALSALETRRATHDVRLRELATQLREQEVGLGTLQVAAGSLDDASAAALRAAREAAWTQHLAALDRESALAFEGQMRAADALADARLAQANDVADMRSLSAAIALTQAQGDRQQDLLDEVARALADLRAQVRREMPVGLDLAADAPLALWLARIERWTKDRETALAAYEALRISRDAAASAEAEAEQARSALAEALAAFGAATQGLSLGALTELGDSVLAQVADRQKARDAADGAIREQERAHAIRKRAADDAAAAMAAWQGKWTAALVGTWFCDRAADPVAVRAILDVLGDLTAELREHTDMRHRIDAMERDRQSYVAEAEAVFSELGERLDPDAVLASARALAERHQHAKQALQRRGEKEGELATLAEDRAALTHDLALHEARKSELLAFLNVSDLMAARHVLEQCAARDRLEGEGQRLAMQMVAEMQAPSREAALERLADLDLAALARENAELSGRLADLDERVKELFAERSRASDRLNAIGGDDAVARLEGERRTVLLDIEDQALRFLRLKTGGLMAAQALRAYREKHRSAMMNRASQAFRLMTREAYSGLATRPDKDRETLIGLARNGGSKLAADMSKGTRFQLYLALRLAGYEEFAAARPSVPFIADDIMETFDEPRSQEVFRLFARMGEVGQVIYLTHHRHLCDLARQVVPSARVHDLGSTHAGPRSPRGA